MRTTSSSPVARKEQLEKGVRPMVEQFLRERGLELSPEKTCVTHIEQGFDFLGQNIRWRRSRVYATPSKKSTHAFLEKVRAAPSPPSDRQAEQPDTCTQSHHSGLGQLSSPCGVTRAFRKAERKIWQAVWRWAKRRHPGKSAWWVTRKYWHPLGRRLWWFAFHTDRGQRTASRSGCDWSIQPTPRSCGTVRSGKMPIPSIPTGVPILKTARSSKKFGIHRTPARRNPS